MISTPKTYESVVILNSALEDPQVDAAVDKIQEFITKQGGAIRTVDKRGRKRLAYPIKKKNNGFFVVLEFDGPSDSISKLARYYALEENVIRYLTIQLDANILSVRELEKTKADEAADSDAESGAADQTP